MLALPPKCLLIILIICAFFRLHICQILLDPLTDTAIISNTHYFFNVANVIRFLELLSFCNSIEEKNPNINRLMGVTNLLFFPNILCLSVVRFFLAFSQHSFHLKTQTFFMNPYTFALHEWNSKFIDFSDWKPNLRINIARSIVFRMEFS